VSWSPPQDDVLRIQCWSGPRNISTALLYSWRERPDTSVVDEPLYAHYLTIDDRSHPGVDDILASQQLDADEVIRDVILGPCETPVLYIKQMAHHLRGVDHRHLAHTENILLVRHPRDMLASLSVQLPECTLADTGLTESVELLDAILAANGTPLVIETQSLLHDPSSVLGAVCDHVGLRFDPAVLSWAAYDNVHRSTGFGPPASSSHPFPERANSILEEALPLFERLNAHAVS